MNLSLHLIFLLFSAVSAVLVNVTIDDSLGDSENGAQIAYLPPGGWNYGPDCRECPATPLLDVKKAHDGTWHDSTSSTSQGDVSGQGLRIAKVPFHGTAIYIYCMVANTYSELTFLIDDRPAGSYVHNPRIGGEPVTYNVPVYANLTLPDGNHTLVIQNGRIGGPKSLILLDYIIYSYEKSPTGPSRHENSGKIVGAVLGSVGGVALCLLGFIWYRQRPRRDDLSYPEELSYQKQSPKPAFPGWLKRRPRTGESPPPNRFSFNPNLLVRPVMRTVNRSRTLLSRHAPPIITVYPQDRPYSRPNSTHHFQQVHNQTPPSPQAVLPVPPPATLDARAEPIQPLSITEWQRRTLREADAVPPPFTAVDVALSSYYEDTSVAPPEPSRREPPPRPARRFTVMNN